MGKKCLYVDYEWCTGCQTCEVACQQEHDGKQGIKVIEQRTEREDSDHKEIEFMPNRNELCDFCKDRLGMGKDPACVHHCMADVMKFGDIDELADEVKEKSVLWIG